MNPPHIKIKNACVNFNKQHIFANINIDIKPGEWVAIIGGSGIGKSSLLKFIAGILHEKNISGCIETSNQIAIQKQIAYMPQTDCLLPWLTVLGNIILGSKLRKQSTKQLKTRACELLDRVGLKDAASMYPDQLSGGMRQRVSLVRTFLENQPIILMDEPFSALDVKTRYELQELSVDLLREKTVIFITHEPSEALRLAHTIYLMRNKPTILQQINLITNEIPRNMTTADMQQQHAKLLQRLLT